MRVYGHRGARGHAPENTLLGIDTAVRLGARWVEVDVQLCAGVPVLLHDTTLDRTTNGSGPVADTTLDALARLDAGAGQRVPTLADTLHHLATADGQVCGLNLELKAEGCADIVASHIADAIARGGWSAERVLVSSFNLRELARMRDCAPHIPRAALYAGVPLDLTASASALGASAVHLSHEFLTTDMLADARARGLRIAVYTVNTPAELAHMRTLGVDGVFTDFPERALAVAAP